MFYKDLSFKTMQAGLDALWMKQKVISDNIANYETPGYKAKSVTFEEVLRKADDGQKTPVLQATVTTDTESTARPDGNNVSMEKESLELWRSYAQYSYLTQKISGQFKNMRYVINQAFK